MHDKVYIVARSRREANDYAASAGLRRGEFAVIADVGQLKAARRGEIHLVEGWEKHPKRHAFRAALRYSRVEVFDVSQALDEDPGSEQTENSTTELDPGLVAAIQSVTAPGADPRDDLTERDLEVAYRYNRLLNAAEDQAASAIDPEPNKVTLRPFAEAEVAALDSEVSSEGEQTREAEPSEDPAPTEEPKVNRRRSRCKKCGILHFKDEPCPSTEDA